VIWQLGIWQLGIWPLGIWPLGIWQPNSGSSTVTLSVVYSFLGLAFTLI
jgi:hypothetical protein